MLKQADLKRAARRITAFLLAVILAFGMAVYSQQAEAQAVSKKLKVRDKYWFNTEGTIVLTITKASRNTTTMTWKEDGYTGYLYGMDYGSDGSVDSITEWKLRKGNKLRFLWDDNSE